MFQQLVHDVYTCILIWHVVVLSSEYTVVVIFKRKILFTNWLLSVVMTFACMSMLMTVFFSALLSTDNDKFLQLFCAVDF